MVELGAALAYMRLEGHRLGGNSFEASLWRSGGRHDNFATKVDACGTIRSRNTMVDRMEAISSRIQHASVSNSESLS